MSGQRATGRERIRRLGLRAIGAARRRTTPGDAGAGASLRRLLLIRPDHLGDVLWLTPALRGLRASLPDAEITVAIGPWSAPILAGNGDYDRLLTIDFPGFTRRPKGDPTAPYRLLRDVARGLRRERYDAALILRDDGWWGALLAATAGIPRRVGFAHPDVAPFLTDSLPLRAGEHTALGNLRLADEVLRQAGRPSLLDGGDLAGAPLVHPLVFIPGPEAGARAAALLASPRSSGEAGPIVAVHASAGVPVKLWDEGRLAAVADRLVAECGARIVLTGVRGDEPLTGAVAARMASRPPLDLTGRTNVAELVALYKGCALVLGPDSGALHLAVAAGTPTVHLYGPADPVRFGPWGDPARHRIVSAGKQCARCGDLSPVRPRGAACMLAIGVEEVLRAARDLLATSGWGGR
jgi:ADP-heptose:LPS heptosyltransferase